MVKKKQRNIPLKNVSIKDSFWSRIQTVITDGVIPYQADILEDKIPHVEKSHAIENFKIAAGESSGEFYGMVFQDSDVAKWLEAVAYSLSIKPDPATEKKADEIISLIGRAQQEDGYLNTYFTAKEPEHRWQNLMECHELYCAGHLTEAAVAYYESTGKREFLDIMQKNADLICEIFEKGKTRGVPGHQEVELALLRLYRVTGKKEYLDTAKHFLDMRGTLPDFFEEETKARGWSHFKMNPENKKYAQNFAPVREQSTAEGHSVRAVYMYTAMADLASETNDRELFDACVRIWNNIVNKRMYITGGIGSTQHGEAFTIDYDLPNDSVYAETCASVAMVFFARRMLEVDIKGEYADIMEKELFNGVLSGMQLDGKKFFYVNPLEVVPGVSGELGNFKHVLPERPAWYKCACCPPNIARLIASLGQYAWGENTDGIYNHMPLGGNAEFQCGGGMCVECESEYPFGNTVRFTTHPKNSSAEIFFAVHIPSWSADWSITVNGEPGDIEFKDGYAYLKRLWSEGDVILLTLCPEPVRMYSNTNVRADAGCVALMRGPVVYCFEEADNGAQLSALRLPRSAKLIAKKENLGNLGETVVLEADGFRMQSGNALYSNTPPESKAVKLRAIPYYKWANRGLGEMRVWIHEDLKND